MKKIETTNIAGAAKAPYIKATHDHYTESISETTANIVKGLMGGYTSGDLVILHGCAVTVTSGAIPGVGTATLAAGAILYNGEIYEVDANAALSTTGVQTLVWSVVSTYRAGDPIAWSDGTSRNLHLINKLILSAGAPGSGIANYNQSIVKYLTTTLRQTALALFSSSNQSGGGATINYIKSGNIVNLSVQSSFTVTTGASATQLVFTIPSTMTLFRTDQNPYALVGNFIVRNETGSSTYTDRAITQGLNTTDCYIDSNNRLVFNLEGSAVSNGQLVSVNIHAVAVSV